MILTTRPLQGWVGDRTPAASRKHHNFTRPIPGTYHRQDIPWSETLVLLDRELVALGASSVVLQISVTEREIRIDGQLRADARPADPAVRLLFESKHGPLTYQCDRFGTWQDNVRAIALGLEALRKVERYAITEHGEQYKGFLQLESGPTFESPRELLLRIGQAPTSSTDEQAWRYARAASHPDRNAGRRDLWDQVEAAAKQLGLT